MKKQKSRESRMGPGVGRGGERGGERGGVVISLLLLYFRSI